VIRCPRQKHFVASSCQSDILRSHNVERLVKSKDFSGSRECAKPHKIVEFELPANKDLVLQFSGSTDPSVTASITPVAASSPN